MPGSILAFLHIAYTMVRSRLNPALGPRLPRDQWATSLGQIVREFLLGIVPLAVVILAALGSILVGLATPTEAAAMGASRALLLMIGYGRFSLRKIKDACLNTLETSSLVLFLAVASNIYGAVFTRLGTSTMIAEGVVGLGLPPARMLVLLMGVIFLLGWPLEWQPSSSFPADLPAGGAGDRDPPPVVQRAGRGQSANGVPPAAGGDAACYLRAVAPQWELGWIYRGMLDFMLLQLIGPIVVFLFLQVAPWLPEVLFGRWVCGCEGRVLLEEVMLW